MTPPELRCGLAVLAMCLAASWLLGAGAQAGLW